MGVWSNGEGRSLAVLASRHVSRRGGGVEILGLGGGEDRMAMIDSEVSNPRP